MKISVLIASLNRSASLLNFLQELKRQAVPEGLDWEVLVVDNNSTDDTKQLISPFIAAYPDHFRYYLETRPGKSAALNTAFAESAGDILAFTDDDCLPNPDWLAAIAAEFSSDPELRALGGRVELYNNQDKPVSIRTCQERTRIASPGDLFSLFIGCNMAVHRSACEAVQGFDTSLGPGNRTRALEDMDFLYRIYKCGLKMIYSPSVLVFHNHGRKSDAQVQSLTRNYLIGRGAFYCKHILSGDRDILKMAYWEISSLTKSFFSRLFRGRAFQEQGRLLWALFLGAVYRLAGNLRFQKT
ncbi:MAG TPA: glycosyltransferase family 2 protein [Candidatus Acidoferrum sp.]|nr:glycosyltransferase family 2 protein [Candidatus Acidoferrum sp.]